MQQLAEFLYRIGLQHKKMNQTFLGHKYFKVLYHSSNSVANPGPTRAWSRVSESTKLNIIAVRL